MNALQLIQAAVEPSSGDRPLLDVFLHTLETTHKKPLVFRTRDFVFRLRTCLDHDSKLGHMNNLVVETKYKNDIPVTYEIEFIDHVLSPKPSHVNNPETDEIKVFNKTRRSFAPFTIHAAKSPQDLLAQVFREIVDYYEAKDQGPVIRVAHAATEPPAENHIKTVFERLLRMFPTVTEGEGYKHVTPDIVGWREHNTDLFLSVLADRTAPKATLHLYKTAPGYAVEVSTGPLHSDPVLDITSATSHADMLGQALTFYRNHLKSKHVQAAAEPGSEVTGTERGFRGAAKLVESKTRPEPDGSAAWLRRVNVGARKVDIAVTNNLATIFNTKNLIPVLIEVVYSDVTGVDAWNKLRRTFTFNARTGTVSMGNVAVPGSDDPARMLRSILSTYVKHVNMFAHGAVEPQEHSIGEDFLVLVRKFNHTHTAPVTFRGDTFQIKSKHGYDHDDKDLYLRSISVASAERVYFVNLQGYQSGSIRELVRIHENSNPQPVKPKTFMTSKGPADLLQQILAFVYNAEHSAKA